jgi:hypothetical protein
LAVNVFIESSFAVESNSSCNPFVLAIVKSPSLIVVVPPPDSP